MPAIAHEEIDERADDRAVDPDQRVAQPRRQAAMAAGEGGDLALALGRAGGDALLRLGDQQRRGDADQRQRRHGCVGERPRAELGDVERARAGGEHGDAVAELVGRGRGALQASRRSPRCGRRRARCPAWPRRRRRARRTAASHHRSTLRIAERHGEQADDAMPICASSIQERRRPSQRVEQRQRHAVDDRRPDELDGVGDADPAHEADRRAG